MGLGGRIRRWRRAPAVSVLELVLLLGVLAWVIGRGAARMPYQWQWYRVPQYVVRVVDGELVWGPLVHGLAVTLEITAWSLLLTVGLGLATALLRLSSSLVGRGLARAYLEIIRNTPLLVQLYVLYFALGPALGLDRYLTGILCLGIFEAAYASEIFRAGILAVNRGQWEAARGLGLSTAATYRFIVLPQALRVILPPMTGQAISLIKASAMVSVIAVFDLTTEGRNIIADTFMTFEIWLTVAAIYLVVTLALSLAVAGLERRLRQAG
jgi:polar amino acid transport system permease protein